MNKNLDEVYITLLKAKEKIYEYTKNKVKNENWRPYYNGIAYLKLVLIIKIVFSMILIIL